MLARHRVPDAVQRPFSGALQSGNPRKRRAMSPEFFQQK
jgi:hypothetical protein